MCEVVSRGHEEKEPRVGGGIVQIEYYVSRGILAVLRPQRLVDLQAAQG